MFNNPKGLTRGDLRAALRAAGLRVSEVQLEQWHKRGLLSRPKRRSLGRGKGMESHYPPVALLEAAAIVVARREVGRLDLIGWYLWCFGFPGHTRQARAFLHRLVEKRLVKSRQAMDDFERGVPGNPIDRAGRLKVSALVGRIRRHVGRDFMPSLERLWAEVDLGRRDWVEGAEPKDWAKLGSLAQALRMEAESSPEALEIAINKTGTQPFRQLFAGLLGGLDLQSLLTALDRVDDRFLEQMRDELQTILSSWAGLLGRDTLLAQPEWFLLYFTVRYASELLRPATHATLTEMHQAGRLPTPAPSPFVQTVRELREKATTQIESRRRSRSKR